MPALRDVCEREADAQGEWDGDKEAEAGDGSIRPATQDSDRSRRSGERSGASDLPACAFDSTRIGSDDEDRYARARDRPQAGIALREPVPVDADRERQGGLVDEKARDVC